MVTYNDKILIPNNEKNSLDTIHPETNTGNVYDFKNSKWLDDYLDEINQSILSHVNDNEKHLQTGERNKINNAFQKTGGIINGNTSFEGNIIVSLKQGNLKPTGFHNASDGTFYILKSKTDGDTDWDFENAPIKIDNSGNVLIGGVDLKQSVSNGKTVIANAITGKGVPTSSDAEFAIMASNIELIKTGLKKASGTAFAINNSLSVSGLDFTPTVVLIKFTSNQINTAVRYTVLADSLLFTGTSQGINSRVGFISTGASVTYFQNNGTMFAGGFNANVNDDQYRDGNVSWLAYE